MNSKTYKLILKYTLFLTLSLLINLTGQTIKLKIVETTDSHGKVFPYNFKDDEKSNSSLAQFSTYLKQERMDSTQSLILLSGGDILQGTPAVYYYNFESTNNEHLYARVMNYMAYDAGAVGNHDIETGHAVYDKFRTELNFPWLAANAIDVNTNEPYFEPYKVIEIKGLKVVVLGMITPGIPNWLPENIWSGIFFDDMVYTAQKWIPIIKENENPDLIIGLFHSGVDYEYGHVKAHSPYNENASLLVASLVPGFDIVFTGHDHQGWNKFIPNVAGDTVLLMGGSSYAREAAEATVVFNYDSSSSNWEKTFAGKLISSSDYEPDNEFIKEFENDFEIVKDYVNQKIGSFSETILSKESLFGDSEFMDLIHTIQLDISGAQISFASPLAMSTSISKGDVFVRDMFNLYRYENLLYTMTLSGREIKDILEYSAGNWFNQMSNENDHMLNFEKDSDGNVKFSNRTNSALLKERYYNYESAAGINYIVDLKKEIGNRVTITGFTNGDKFEVNKMYKVAMNSYRGNGGGGHLTLGAKITKDEISKRIINSTEKDLRFYLMEWIKKEKYVEPYRDNNWVLVPEEWIEKAKLKDEELLFNSN